MSTVSTPVDDLLAFDTTSRAWRPVPGEPVVIYGAGGFARALLRVLRRAGADVLFAIDECAAEIGALDGVPVHRSEASPLRGAEELIRRGRPRLAICVYLGPEDLWHIPMFVRDLDLSYAFYLRATVCSVSMW